MDEVRAQERAAITLRVDYKRLNTFFSDYTKNISKGGTFIKTTKPLPVGTQFQFVLALPEGVGDLELVGEVVWAVKREAGDSVIESSQLVDESEGMGIRFIFGTPADREKLESHVEKLMSESLGDAISSKILKASKKE
ncbi:MAG: TIGR02266 family protein [Polyangiaceae bacterium]|nr:TIGR02266 family protein [Polyangiaceae bacterium]